MTTTSRMFEFIFILCEIAVLILYATLTDYSLGVGTFDVSQETSLTTKEVMQTYYPMWQDVHVMIYIGFGFLMVFLKTSSWTAVGFNFLLSAWAFQWSILVVAFWRHVMSNEWHTKIHLDINSLVVGDFAAASCMICYGALLGKVDLFQMWFIITLQVVFYGLNEAICIEKYHAIDMGGSMIIHTFGCYFGLAASYFLQRKKALKEHDEKVVGGYNAQTIAAFGTIFLYMYWPSFNSAAAPAISQQRVVVNTCLAISGSCIGALACARAFCMKLEMEILLNATLAGGVVIGAASDVVVSPGLAIIIGMGGGAISAFGFAYLSEGLRKSIQLHDTCGVHNLHGIPGILGGVLGSITTALAGSAFKNVAAVQIVFPQVANGHRTFNQQAGF